MQLIRRLALMGALVGFLAGVTACEPPPPKRTDLAAGASLASGAQLTSPSGRYRMVMQTDGNLVTYGPGGVVWQSRTGVARSTLAMQTDGNLVIYAPGGRAVWNAGTTGTGPGIFLRLQDDGNGVLYTPANGPVWSTHGGRTGRTGHTLVAGQQLGVNGHVRSLDGRFKFIMQGDGNVVLYGPTGVHWQSRTGVAGSVLEMQPDGNLVVYAPGRQAVWNSQTTGRGGSQLDVQNDGNVVIYDPAGRPIWSVLTGVLEQVGSRGQTTNRNTGAAGNCTWWVYERAREAIGVYPLIMGNAKDMPANARARGWTVTSTPRSRSMVVRQPGQPGAHPTYGHVMWVKQVSGNRVLISDMNYDGRGGVRDDVWLTLVPSDQFILID